ncbi:MAG TPA: trigger factor [Candidatus Limnocylindrales bacterium]
MNVTSTPAPKSSVLLEVELPPERLGRAVDEATRRLARRTRVAGFRPGKAPRVMLERVLGARAVLDEAVERLVEDAYREALIEKEILPLTNPDVEVVQAEEGKPLVFKATVQVRPDVKLGDYRNFNFRPEIEAIDDAKVERVVEDLRDQYATLAAVEDRGARTGDYAVVGYAGTRDGLPFEGGSANRMPVILGQERLIAGFEDRILGLRPGERIDFDITFPADYGDASLAGQPAHFELELKELREKIQPALDDEFARGLGEFADLAGLRADIRRRLERNALDHARHEFADKIIEYAIANSTIELPDVLVDQEVEVMHDEFRTALGRQGVTDEDYEKATGQSHAQLHEEFRPRAEHRVKVLLALTEIAGREGVDVSADEVEAEIERSRRRYATNPKLIRYVESERGRNFIRSTLRRTKLVEKLVDDWLAAHPEHPALPHADAEEPTAVEAAAAEVEAQAEHEPGSRAIEPASEAGVTPGRRA